MWGHIYSATAEVDGSDEVLSVAKAGRGVFHPLYLNGERFASRFGNDVKCHRVSFSALARTVFRLHWRSVSKARPSLAALSVPCSHRRTWFMASLRCSATRYSSKAILLSSPGGCSRVKPKYGSQISIVTPPILASCSGVSVVQLPSMMLC